MLNICLTPLIQNDHQKIKKQKPKKLKITTTTKTITEVRNGKEVI